MAESSLDDFFAKKDKSKKKSKSKITPGDILSQQEKELGSKKKTKKKNKENESTQSSGSGAESGSRKIEVNKILFIPWLTRKQHNTWLNDVQIRADGISKVGNSSAKIYFPFHNPCFFFDIRTTYYDFNKTDSRINPSSCFFQF